MSISDTNLFVESPYKTRLNGAVNYLITRSENDDEVSQQAMKNALDFAISKSMSNRRYEGDNKAYLAGLLSDLSKAIRQYEYDCFSHKKATYTFEYLKQLLLRLLDQESNAYAA